MSGRAAIVKEQPEIAVWMEEMALHKTFGFCPADPVQRAFMLEFVPKPNKEDDE